MSESNFNLFLYQVDAIEPLNLRLHVEPHVWLYVHDKGEEYYLHYDYWPHVPYIHHSKPQEVSMDLIIEKNIEISNKACNDGSYNYFGKCVFQIFRYVSYIDYRLINASIVTC